MTVYGYTPNPTVPKFRDFRRTNDGVAVADVGFKKQLWALDPEYDVVWDWASGKWEIWKFPGQALKKYKNPADPKAFHVMTVQTQDRSFRELGADIILHLQQWSMSRWSAKQLADYFDQMDDNIIRARERDTMNKLEAIRLETDLFVRGVPISQVPFNYQVKPHEERFLINAGTKPTRINHHIFKIGKDQKISRAIGGNYA